MHFQRKGRCAPRVTPVLSKECTQSHAFATARTAFFVSPAPLLLNCACGGVQLCLGSHRQRLHVERAPDPRERAKGGVAPLPWNLVSCEVAADQRRHHGYGVAAT
jgi:hypothetical protein